MQARAPTTPKGGRSSAQAIESGDGYVEFTAALSTGDVYCGLSRGDSTQSHDDIDFAIYASAHNARAVYVVEGGVVKGAYGTFAAGDRLRVAVEGGVVKYYRVAGGALTLLRASAAAPRYPLVADAALYGAGDRLDDVVVGGGVGAASNVRWLVSDHLGTPRMVVDESGSLAGVTRHDYLPFGEEIGAGVGGRTTNQGYSQFDGVRQGFTGYEKDGETGLNFAQARYYASTQGRFTSPDPLSGVQEQPQSWNRYAYVLNNPLMYVDPTGLRWAQRSCEGGTCYEWFDDYDRDENGLTEYGRALKNDGWSQVAFDETQAFRYHVPSRNGDTLTELYVLNPNGTHHYFDSDCSSCGGVRMDFGTQMALTGPAQAGGRLLFGFASSARSFAGSFFGRQATTEAAEGGGTTLFRAVLQPELDDIRDFGAYRIGGNSIAEGKYFFESADNAAGFAQKMFRIRPQEGPYTITSANVSNSVLRSSSRTFISGEGQAVVIPRSQLPLGPVRVSNSSPLPPQ